MDQAIAAAGRWGAALIVLIVTGRAPAPAPSSPASAPDAATPEQRAGADLATADAGPEVEPGAAGVQEAALRSGQPGTTAAAASDVELRTESSERGLVVSLGNLSFAPGSATLQRQSTPLLTRVAALLRDHPERNVLIEGHTDATGTPTENLHLSPKRAEAVQEGLVDHGVDPRRLILRGYGARYAVAGNDTEAGRRRNRRVEVVILEPGRTTAPPPPELAADR